MSASSSDTLSTCRVGISAYLLSLSSDYRAAGISRYIFSLLRYLPGTSQRLQYLAYVGDRRMEACAPAGLLLRRAPISTRHPLVRIFWEQIVQPVSFIRDGIKLAHGTAYALPLNSPVPGVVTIHDLSFYVFPEVFNVPNRVYLTWMSRRAARRAVRIIAVSEWTKRDVVNLLGVPAQRVVVIPNGVDPDFVPIEDKEAVARFRREKGLPEHFILYLGTLEPRKNLLRLVEAYAQLVREARLPHRLVLAGSKGWQYEDLFRLVETLGLQDRVLFPGFVPYEEQKWWYNCADLFVYPSLYEGFGLPVLEAMACGTPVVVSRDTSLTELVGDAGLTVDRYEPEHMAGVMRQVLSDRALWEELRRRGVQRAAQYSWQRTALETARVYEQVLFAMSSEGESHA